MQDANTAPQLIAADARTTAKRLGLSVETIRRMIRAGELPASRVGHRVLIQVRDVDALLTRTRIAAPVGG